MSGRRCKNICDWEGWDLESNYKNMSVFIFKYQARQISCHNTISSNILADQRHLFMAKVFMFFIILHAFFAHPFLNYVPHLNLAVSLHLY